MFENRIKAESQPDSPLHAEDKENTITQDARTKAETLQDPTVRERIERLWKIGFHVVEDKLNISKDTRQCIKRMTYPLGYGRPSIKECLLFPWFDQ